MFQVLVGQAYDEAWFVFAVFLRVGPAVALAPGYGEKSVPMRARLVLGLVLSVAIAPIVRPMLPPTPPESVDLAIHVGRELIIGFFFGLFARGIVFLLETAGAIISQTVTMAQMFPSNSEPMSIMAHFLTVAGLAILFSTGIAQDILRFFLSSYLFEIPTLFGVYAFMADRVAELADFIFRNGVVLASGFIGMFLIYYLFTGFLNKTMPQFMVIFVGVPFVALFSINVLRQNIELVLTSWQAKTLLILKMPLDHWR